MEARELLSLLHERRRLLPAYVLGLPIRRRFTTAGLLAVIPGLPLPKIINQGEIHVSNIALFPGVRIECLHGARIEVGKGTYLNRNTEIVAGESIKIGRNCKIAWDVLIMDTDQHALVPGGPVQTGRVMIGDDVWIGARAIILKGVEIGDGAVIGAGAIVTKNVPPRTVVVGPAAAVVRTMQ